MMVSPPSSPDGGRMRPGSIHGSSPEPTQKQRPLSLIQRPVRSQSRMSQTSSRTGTRASDDEAKTSVRVVVRVRPPLGPGDPGFDLIPQRFQRSMLQVTTDTTLGVDSPQGRKMFIFDRVFGAETSQKGLWDYLEDSVDSFVQGYNVSVLAYGQSGSGKSYTMGTSGPADQFDPSSKGVIPRAATHLFDKLGVSATRPAHNRQGSGFTTTSRYSVANMNQIMASSKLSQATESDWEMSVTYLEIYNEQPRDLLLPEAQPIHERPTVQIREDQKGRIFVEGLKAVLVNSIEELLAVLNHGSSIRQTDATAVNSKSSRSHAIFTINLRQAKPQSTRSPAKDKQNSTAFENPIPESFVHVESKLHFVDLAGSERLKNTGATGDRAKEGISINAGLASLGKVISQLSSRSSGGHVSYRDSKLTRILQDSLGGNAITYMIACVTPAEFHLSETLNTVQYAQRARNIQSKPKIQAINEDAEKQAVIDRLRSEVAFLRQQIRSSESNERKRSGSNPERPHEREMDLQTQLLDVQESYTALSQRHAKLISQLTNSDETTQHSTESVPSESAVDRLKRSQAYQEQIEQVVLEYEKTIQSLEASLQTTRSTLANTESTLLEKETKCAYIETMNQQLNTRVQKLMDRESNTESYLREMEARLEDKSSGGEKNDALIAELRKELARIRESESNAEDYICTLEERLAEADQDSEMMQREIERLEQLVERQRSLGKLDNLLHELDRSQQREKPSELKISAEKQSIKVNGISKEPLEAVREADEPETDKHDSVDLDAAERLSEADANELKAIQTARQLAFNEQTKEPESSPAQQKYIADQFEAVSQELFDLKIDHESAINELDLMRAKYEEALHTLAKMQDSNSGTRHISSRSITSSADPNSRPLSYLEDARVSELKIGEPRSSSRSLSSELSSVGEAPGPEEADHAQELGEIHEVQGNPADRDTPDSEHSPVEYERLQSLVAEHEKNLATVSEQYSQLRMDHSDTLRKVDKLKTEIARSRQDRPASPSLPGMIRRMTSTVHSGVDRGQRSIVSLRALLAEEFHVNSEKMEGAETHLNAATQELQSRMDRIQSLEAEVKNVRKEMDMKSTIISGLTRERNSVRAGTPVDLNMVSQLRDQLIQKELELKSLHEGYAAREQELQEELSRLSVEGKNKGVDGVSNSQSTQEFQALQEELAEMYKKHETAQKSAEDSGKKLVETTAELELARASLNNFKPEQNNSSGRASSPVDSRASRQSNFEDVVVKLKHELEQQAYTNAASTAKISELTEAHAAASRDLAKHQEDIKARTSEIGQHKEQIAKLQNQIQEAEAAVEFYKHGLKSLHETHANEIEEMKLSHAAILAAYDDKMNELIETHNIAIEQHASDAKDSKAALQAMVDGAGDVLGHPTSHDMLVSHIQDLAEERRHVAEANARLVTTNAELERQVTGRQSLEELEEAVEQASLRLANYQETIRNLANEVGNHEETIRTKEKVIQKHQSSIEALEVENHKKVVMIEELEQQLQNSYEQHHNRVSVMQAQGNQALVEAQNRIASLEKEVQRVSMTGSDEGASLTNTMKSRDRPQSPVTEQRSNSMTSNLCKSGSIASLPSPPPAIPLPPLPSLPGIAIQTNNPSPPQSRHASKEVPPPATPNSATSPRESHNARHSATVIEEQENRLRTMEKHLHAEKQLTATLEEALVDLETQSNKLRVDAESWKKKAWSMEEELSSVRKERRTERLSVQAVEEEVKKRREAEAARAQLEERMRLLQQSNGKKKKKQGGLNCF